MKRHFRKPTILTMAALLAITAALPAFGEEDTQPLKKGWHQEEDGRWTYLDSSGDRLIDEWIWENGIHYYLDDEGYMLTDAFLDDGGDTYYLDENGARAENRWASASNAERQCSDEDLDTVWYYFGSNGKAKNVEGKALRLTENGETKKYFFDSDGHMLSGWQEITYLNGDAHTFYLGDENDGHAHMLWQYLAPPDEDSEVLKADENNYKYDGLEMFYFGYGGEMTYSDESKLEGEYFVFDLNGVMLKGWQPGILPASPELGVNKYYDEETGVRASGWIYVYDPDEEAESGEPHWFYCDKKTGLAFNQGGKDADLDVDSGNAIAAKRIDGHTYFFDNFGHMLTGMISTEGVDLGDCPFVEEEYEDLTGGIGGAGNYPAGIYYLSQKDATLGQLAKDGELKLTQDGEVYAYYLNTLGRAYQNALVDGCIYGPDGLRIDADTGKDIVTLTDDIYDESDYRRDGTLKENAEPVARDGDQIIVGSTGRVRKNGKVKLDGTTYTVKNYVVVDEE